MNSIVIDCHYCEYAICQDPDGACDCYVDDECYFDHHVEDSKAEAESCNNFRFCNIFPKN